MLQNKIVRRLLAGGLALTGGKLGWWLASLANPGVAVITSVVFAAFSGLSATLLSKLSDSFSAEIQRADVLPRDERIALTSYLSEQRKHVVWATRLQILAAATFTGPISWLLIPFVGIAPNLQAFRLALAAAVGVMMWTLPGLARAFRLSESMPRFHLQVTDRIEQHERRRAVLEKMSKERERLTAGLPTSHSR